MVAVRTHSTHWPVVAMACWNLERFANVVVEVPRGSTTAVVCKQDDAAKPSWFRNLANSKLVVLSSVMITGWALAGAVGLRRAGGPAAWRRSTAVVRVGRWREALRARRRRETEQERNSGTKQA